MKTASPNRRAFHLQTAHERLTQDRQAWYVFVRFHHDSLERPTFHIVPWNVVASVLREKRLGAEREGKIVKPGVRNFLTEWIDQDLHREAWESLLQPVPELALIRRV